MCRRHEITLGKLQPAKLKAIGKSQPRVGRMRAESAKCQRVGGGQPTDGHWSLPLASFVPEKRASTLQRCVTLRVTRGPVGRLAFGFPSHFKWAHA